jgi:protein involved in temperature-dependent protein secretion
VADADDLLRAGDLAGARAALVESVRRAPGDPRARMFLFQLQCVMGEWDKALVQLRTLAQLAPEAEMLGVAYRQAIEAERVREQVFAGAAQPALLVSSSPWAGDLAAALGLFAQGRADEAQARRDAGLDAAPDTPGEIDGTGFEWIADADGRFGPTFEAVIAGRWGLVPFDAVASLTSEGARDLRDLVWYPVQLAFKSGQSVAAFLPLRYPATVATGEAELLLARRTAWRDGPAGQEGLGQRLWTLSDGSDVDLLSLRRLVLH